MKQTDTEVSSKWLNMSIDNSKNAYYALRLCGLMLKHQNLLNQAIEGRLSEESRGKVITWIINNLPKTNNAENDNMTLEMAWMSYAVANTTNHIDQQKESDFLNDVRAKYLSEKLKLGQQI